MKLYYLGSVVHPSTMDQITLKSRIKPSHAPVYFQVMALKGIKEYEKDLRVHGIPPIKTYPGGSLIAWGRKQEELAEGMRMTWLPTINIQLLKQLTIALSTFFSVLWWLLCNRKCKDKLLISYYIYLPYSLPALLLCKLFACKTSVIITDSIDYSYQSSGSQTLKSALFHLAGRLTNRVRNCFDSYIFLTRHMLEVFQVNHKKYIIMEGFCDSNSFKGMEGMTKAKIKTLMYAGLLSEDFGVTMLVDAFLRLPGDYQLWLFGSGECEAYLRECESKDSRVHFFGKVSRKELLEHERKAHLLISMKPSKEDHGRYAFPSKILEYMSSGTPVLSTRVGGIPEEYFDYLYPLEEETETGFISAISQLLQKSEEELEAKGKLAKEYALQHKSYQVQGKRIVELFRECLNDDRMSN